MHWSAPNSLFSSFLQPCTNSMWGDESEAVAPIIWLYQTVDARKEEVFFPNLLITLRRHEPLSDPCLPRDRGEGVLGGPHLTGTFQCSEMIKIQMRRCVSQNKPVNTRVNDSYCNITAVIMLLWLTTENTSYELHHDPILWYFLAVLLCPLIYINFAKQS